MTFDNSGPDRSGETAASAVSVPSGRPQTAPKPSFRLCISESSPILHFSCPRPISDLIFSDVDHLRQALSECPIPPGPLGLLVSSSFPKET